MIFPKKICGINITVPQFLYNFLLIQDIDIYSEKFYYINKYISEGTV